MDETTKKRLLMLQDEFGAISNGITSDDWKVRERADIADKGVNQIDELLETIEALEINF